MYDLYAGIGLLIVAAFLGSSPLFMEVDLAAPKFYLQILVSTIGGLYIVISEKKGDILKMLIDIKDKLERDSKDDTPSEPPNPEPEPEPTPDPEEVEK